MKSEEEILKKIIDFIEPDKNIKVAVLNGSRTNSKARRDFMRDYDVALYVQNIKEALKYKKLRNWVNTFGDLAILQQNDFENNAFIFLLQYSNSLRIDLSFYDIKYLEKNLKNDSLSILLYDREELAGNIPEPKENSYFVERPSKQVWNETLNELWWLQCCIAKELWRDEIPLAKKLYDVHMMDCLRDLVSWYIAVDKEWSVNVGYGGKWFKNFLSSEIYKEYLYFYSGANKDEQWEKLLNIGKFIRKIAQPLSHKLRYDYPKTDDINVSKYIRKIHRLKPDAESL